MTSAEPQSLAALESAERMLAEIATLDDAQTLIGLAEQARIYARQSQLGTSAINHATVIKIRAERRLASIIEEGQDRGKIARPGPAPSQTSLANDIATYADLGLTRQKVEQARVLRNGYTDDDLEVIRNEADRNDKILTRTDLIRDARKVAQAQASPIVRLRRTKRRTVIPGKTNRPEEIFLCPECGHRGERSVFRKEILKWRK